MVKDKKGRRNAVFFFTIFFDGVNEKKCIFAASNQGLLAQWFRALLSHGRGHRFNSYTTHKKGPINRSFFFVVLHHSART